MEHVHQLGDARPSLALGRERSRGDALGASVACGHLFHRKISPSIHPSPLSLIALSPTGDRRERGQRWRREEEGDERRRQYRRRPRDDAGGDDGSTRGDDGSALGDDGSAAATDGSARRSPLTARWAGVGGGALSAASSSLRSPFATAPHAPLATASASCRADGERGGRRWREKAAAAREGEEGGDGGYCGGRRGRRGGGGRERLRREARRIGSEYRTRERGGERGATREREELPMVD